MSTEDDSIEADGAFEKDSLGSTGDAGDITPDDARTPAVGEDEAGVFSPVSDVPAEPSALPSNPQISDFPSADIDEGACEISNAGSNRALDVSGGSCDNGANVQQYVLDHTNAQLWDFVARQDGGYFIKSGLVDYVLDISGGSVANGGNARVYRWNATNAQVWNLVKIAQTIDDGLYEIYSRVDGNRLIDVSGGSKVDDAKLQVWNRNGTLAQKWSVSVCDNGSVLIKGANSGKYLSQSDGKLMSVKEATEGSHWIPRVSPRGGLVLVNAVSGAVIDLTGGNAAAGTLIQMYANNLTAAQAWRFVCASLIDDGYYVLVNQSSDNRVLDVAGGSYNAGAKVQLYTANGSNAQKWHVRSLGNGAYSLTAFVSGKALDVPSANASNGASLQQWDWNGSGAQKWLLRLADDGGIAIYSMLADGSFALMNSDNGLVLGNDDADSWRFDATNISEQPYADANAAQRHLVDVAYAVPTPGANLCSEWISRVFNTAGYGYAYGDACDMFWAYCHDNNRANLKVGMIVAVPSHSHNWAGSRWGHIAIYIGDGKVIENIGRVNVRGLNDWVNYYGTTYTPLWGWYRNIALC